MNPNPTSLNQILNFLNEAGMLAKIPRSGLAFFGSGTQSVADHSFRVALIAYVLAELSPSPVKMETVLLLALFHDLPEARTGDLNYLQKRYVQVDQEKVLKEIEDSNEFGGKIANWIKVYEKKDTVEAHLVHDADQLEFLLVIKREMDLGNPSAQSWFERGISRLLTPIGKKMAEALLTVHSDTWWLQARIRSD